MRPNTLLITVLSILDNKEYKVLILDANLEMILCSDKEGDILTFSFDEILKMLC